MLGMLKALQYHEPRWLALHEELGCVTEPRPAEREFEQVFLNRVRSLNPRGRLEPRRRWSTIAAVAAAAAILAGSIVGIGITLRPRAVRAPSNPNEVEPPRSTRIAIDDGLAIVVKLEDVAWNGPATSEGAMIGAGRLRIRSGRATLAMLTGVSLDIVGPAEIELVSDDRVICHQGNVRARVPGWLAGFVISGPGSAIVDMGTEFGIKVGPDGKLLGKVFEGRVEAAVLNDTGSLRHSLVMKEDSAAFEIDPARRRISNSAAARAEQFAEPWVPPAIPLVLDPGYRDAVLRAQTRRILAVRDAERRHGA